MARRKKPGIDPEKSYEVVFAQRAELDLGKDRPKRFYPGQTVWLKGKWLLKLLPGEGVLTWRES